MRRLIWVLIGLMVVISAVVLVELSRAVQARTTYAAQTPLQRELEYVGNMRRIALTRETTDGTRRYVTSIADSGRSAETVEMSEGVVNGVSRRLAVVNEGEAEILTILENLGQRSHIRSLALAKFK